MNILVFAPHNDDEVLGVGGTIKRFANERHAVFVCEVTSGPNAVQLQANARQAHRILGVRQSIFLGFPVGKLRTMNQMELNEAVSGVIRQTEPEVVFLPFWGDMHQDHREVTESALVALRPIGDYSVREVYLYETLSETGWHMPDASHSFMPNTWVDITETLPDKLAAMRCYESQLLPYPHPRSEDAIRALAQCRGASMGFPYGESFMQIRHIIR